jgi:hypothetical protein
MAQHTLDHISSNNTAHERANERPSAMPGTRTLRCAANGSAVHTWHSAPLLFALIDAVAILELVMYVSHEKRL